MTADTPLYTRTEMAERVVTATGRDWSSEALLDACLPGHASQMAPVLGYGLTQDRNRSPKVTNPHGFSIEWLKLPPGQSVSPHRLAEKQVVIAQSGRVEVVLKAAKDAVTLRLGTKDTLSIPAQIWRSIRNTGHNDAELLMITTGDGRKRPEFAPAVVAAAAQQRRMLDASGFVAACALVPSYAFGKR